MQYFQVCNCYGIDPGHFQQPIENPIKTIKDNRSKRACMFSWTIQFFATLTHFSPMSHFYTPWKRQKTFCFLTFSGGIEYDTGLKWVKLFLTLLLFWQNQSDFNFQKCKQVSQNWHSYRHQVRSNGPLKTSNNYVFCCCFSVQNWFLKR